MKSERNSETRKECKSEKVQREQSIEIEQN